MAKYLVAVGGVVALLTCSALSVDPSENDAIKKTALDYGQGWYEGNAERMERALHPDLAKRILGADPRSGKGKIEHMSALTLVQMTRKGGGTKTPTDKRRTVGDRQRALGVHARGKKEIRHAGRTLADGRHDGNRQS